MFKLRLGKCACFAAFCRRHPLFALSIVASAGVGVADQWLAAGLGLVLGFGLLGGCLSGWRTGLAWICGGAMAVGAFAWRLEIRKTDERQLLESTGAEMQGRALRDARPSGKGWSVPAVLLSGSHAGAKVWWEGRGVTPVAGSVVKASGTFGALLPPRNPGEFDRSAWLRGQGVVAVFHAGWVNGETVTGDWAAFAAKFRRGFRNAVTAGLAEDSQAAIVIRAVVIGETPSDAQALIAAFRDSGTLHAFSVSGLHVTLVGSIAWFVLSLTGMPRRQAVLVLLPMIFGYTWLTGNSPPAERSAWMAAVFLGAFVSRRRPDLLNALGAVLFVAVLWDGSLIFQPGVQLSYGVVAAIAIGGDWGTRLFSWIAKPPMYVPPPLLSRWQRSWLWLRMKLAQCLGISVVAGIGSSPLTLYHFGLFTPVSVVAGVFFTPLVFVLLSVALLSASLYPVLPPAARWVNRMNGYVADACVLTVQKFAEIPGGHFLWRKSRPPCLLVYDLDHGAAAACFSGGERGAVLLDCADRTGFKYHVAPSLQRLGIFPDSVVLSHADGGHLGGGAAVWAAFPIRQVLLPVERARSRAYQAWVKEAPHAGIQTLQAADFRELPMPDGARLEVLHVPDGSNKNASADDRVAIFRLHWRGWKLLFTSDAGIDTETQLLAAHKDLTADVIIAGHHRHDPSLGDALLDAVNPRIIIASHADSPVSEKLKPETVDYWRSRGIHVIHQGESGGVSIVVDEAGNLKLEGFVDHSVKVLNRR